MTSNKYLNLIILTCLLLTTANKLHSMEKGRLKDLIEQSTIKGRPEEVLQQLRKKYQGWFSSNSDLESSIDISNPDLNFTQTELEEANDPFLENAPKEQHRMNTQEFVQFIDEVHQINDLIRRINANNHNITELPLESIPTVISL